MPEKMIQRHYTVRFLTPAFLGNAEQNGQWRTPPFKALLRQWWRVAVAAEQKFNVDAIRRMEGQLFGVAADKDGESRKSQLRIRLSRWDDGKQKDWHRVDMTRVSHPEVKNPVGAHLYLGYGPLVFGPGGTALKKKQAAIQAGEEAKMSLAFPESHAAHLDMALWLLDRYGAAGGRSRNGWGSISLIPDQNTPALPLLDSASVLRDWQQALALDWPHAIGSADGKALVWQTAEHAEWNALMATLAKLKIDLRTQFRFTTGRDAMQPEARHWLSYPVTNHSVRPWGGNARLPNSLRFKVRQTANGKLVGVIFHVPCLPPAAFRPDLKAIDSVWRDVHSFLGSPARNLNRIDA